MINKEKQRVPAASFQKLRKSGDRQAALIALGLSASSAKEYADKLEGFTDAQFNQMMTNATTSIEKAETPKSSVDLTVQILKARYGV